MSKVCTYCGNAYSCEDKYDFPETYGICDECNYNLEQAYTVAQNLRLEAEHSEETNSFHQHIR